MHIKLTCERWCYLRHGNVFPQNETPKHAVNPCSSAMAHQPSAHFKVERGQAEARVGEGSVSSPQSVDSRSLCLRRSLPLEPHVVLVASAAP